MELQGRSLILTVSVLTSLGFMLIGYDNGLMGGLVNTSAFKDTFDSPDADIIGVIVAIFEIGCFFGAIFAAIWGEKLGRRRSILIGCIVLIIGAVLQAASFSRAMMIVGRIVSGLGLGTVNSTVPVMQAEFSPKSSRGIYVCAQLSTLNFGIFLVYWIDYALSSHTGSYAWRVPVILQCVPIIVIICLLTIIPETPRWLAAHDRPEECLKVLAQIQGTSIEDPDVRALHSVITQTVAYETSIGSGSWKDLLKEDSIKSRKRLILACLLQSMQQLGGINAIIYYSSTLFEKSVGFSAHMSALMSGFLQTWFFVASFIPWVLIDRIGRRPLLLSMISVMAATMAVQAGLIYQVENNTASSHAAGIAAAAMLFIFQGAFTIGFQATVWVYPSEILPLRLRQRGSSISTAANWIFNYMIVQITPISINNIGWRTYIIFAVLNTLWVPLIFLFFPETKGLELEDVDQLFGGEDIIRNLDEKNHGTVTMLESVDRDGTGV
ncbi:general substrate transporter [Fusarium flagelliforme]|uniref:Sugar transporter stl1 n=1 Tax=Fusarium flagelliforme TaxID=2675880 RepID=A0A395MK07_9HYPO|nr:general substrate transporter [Fusarium flagelliforme]KAH7193696.1 general substrate transporter [Fusarium flagelliforme]RFN48274.1 sugar transporter stl1 [Fusarium flagelliforme]